ncbi:MAG: hypothetical protein WD557_11145 [Dehalococcoidia bacterium]
MSSAPPPINWLTQTCFAPGDHACIVAEVTNAGQREQDPSVLTLDEVGVKYGG